MTKIITSQEEKKTFGEQEDTLIINYSYRTLIAAGDTHAIVGGKAYSIESSSEKQKEFLYIFASNNNKNIQHTGTKI
ncbi:MAG: hypothetical protein ACI8RD_004374 [Bacillariaceae sp.]|jgi:hypothetical protein